MKQYMNRQRSIAREVSRFGFRKASVGLASCLLGTLLFLGGPVTVAADTGLQLGQVVSQSEMRLEYQHAFLSELTQTERQAMVKGLPENIKNGERIIFVYSDEAPATAATSLPRTGGDLSNWTLGLAGFVLLVTAVASKRKRPLVLVGLTLSGLGATALGPVAEAYAPGHLVGHNRVVTVAVGQTLPEPVLVNGKKPIGHIRLADKLTLVEEGKKSEQDKLAPVLPPEPDKPVIPEPVSPLEPDKPVIPEPVSPLEPDKPVIPEPVSPLEPDKPVIPEPVSPLEPDKPVIPEPVSPLEPDKPVIPEPVSPPEPDKPATPLPVRTEEMVQEEQVLAFDTKYVEDPSLAKGEEKLVQEGQAGSLTIHYKVIKEDGQEISRSEIGRDRVEPVQEIIAIGTAVDALPTDYPVVEDKPELVLTEKRETSEQALPFDTQYVDNPNRPAGTADIEVQAGSEGVIRRIYAVIFADGQEVARSLENEERKEPTPRIVERSTGVVGSRVETRTETVAFETIVKEDSSLASGTERVEREGEEGVDTVTVTTPTLNGQVNGDPVETRVRTKEPVNRIVVRGSKVRTKPIVTIDTVHKNELGRAVQVTYGIGNPTDSLVSARAQLYKENVLLGTYDLQLVGDRIQPLDLTNLDYYEEYTLKTEVTYDLKNNQGQQTEVQTDTENFELLLKKIEFKDVDSVSLYKLEDKEEKRLMYLDSIETDLSKYLVKIKSDKHKEILLPVSSITEETQDGVPVYKVTVVLNELVQDNQGQYVENYSFYVAKPSSTPGVYTSFKDLVTAMKQDATGTYILGADMTADEVTLAASDLAYVSETFKGTLIGENAGKRYAIYNLAKPLFNILEGARVRELDLREVSIQSNESEQAPLAKEARKSKIEHVAVEGSVTGYANIAGIVVRANSETTLKNTSFTGSLTAKKQEGGENLVGGLVALATGNKTTVSTSFADVTIYTAGRDGNHRTGALVGIAHTGATLRQSYATGYIYANSKNGQTGGIIGSTWQNGHVQDVVGSVKVVNGNAIHGDNGYTNADVKDSHVIAGQYAGNKDKWANEIGSEDAAQKIATMGVTATVSDSGQLLKTNQYSVDYTTLSKAEAGRKVAYENMEKLLPFYNKELIVYYGNKLSMDDKLSTTALLDVVPMIGNQFVTDVHQDRQQINRLLLHYADKTVAYLDIAYKEDFRNPAISEYTVVGKDILYTPEQFLSSYTNVINQVATELTNLTFDSTEVRNLLNLPKDTDSDKLAYLYLQPTFDTVQQNVAAYLRKVLAMDKTINTIGRVVEDQLIQKLTDNKAALLLGLSYFNRWYNVNYGDINAKDIMTYKLDFFGNTNVSVLDTLIAVGKLGYNDLHAKSNVSTYDKSLRQASGQTDLFAYLDAYRQLFLPTKGNNEWLKENSKAYIVELASLVDEARTKQEAGYNQKNNKYSVGVYDRITADNWGHKNMLLPLLTMSDEQLYVISIMNTISFGGYERYRDKADVNFELKKYVRSKVDEVAQWQRDHADFWYKMLNAESKEKMFGSVPNFDGFNYKAENGTASWRTLADSSVSIQEFFGPINKWYAANGSGAYANGSLTHFVVDRLLDKYGTSVYTHEMVHNYDGRVYFEGHGRREGMGAELYALGLLQAPFQLHSGDLGLNTLFTEESDSTTRLHTASPKERFQTVADLNQYVHGMFDLIYILDYLEGTSVLKQSNDVKKKWLRKIENYYITDKDDKETHAGNKIRLLTDDEVNQLTDFDKLIEGDIINRRNYRHSDTLGRNGYYTVNMLSPIYAALDNPHGAPGDLMFRRMAYELLAAKGYQEGFLPYVSGKLSKVAFDQGSKTWSNWSGRYVGLVTDTHVLKEVFGDKYASWDDFKKDMYQERLDKRSKLKSITIQYELGKANSTQLVQISSYEQLQDLMDRAVEEDMKRINNATNHIVDSWVQRLKTKVYNAYLRDTDDFKISIFND